MLNHRFAFLLLITVASACAQTEPVTLPAVTVYSSQVANQEPAGSFAMPVSALSYEPLVDVQARNMAEGQADVSIRGGTFENTGFSIGAVPIYDPQTGHYFAELPIAPAMPVSVPPAPHIPVRGITTCFTRSFIPVMLVM